MSGLFHTRSYSRRPQRFVYPKLGHPHQDGALIDFAFLEGTGTYARETCSGVDGAATNAVFDPDGMLFNGSSAYLSMGSVPAFLGGLSRWSCYVLAKGDSTTGQRELHRASAAVVRKNSSNKPDLWWESNGGWKTSGAGSTSMNDNLWHSWVALYDGSNSKMYIDGVEESSTVSGSSLTTVASSDYFIGAASAASSFWSGPIAQVIYYGKTLSEDLIQDLHHRPYARFERRIWVPVAAAPGGRIMSGLVGSGGLAADGGLAGSGGGLAG